MHSYTKYRLDSKEILFTFVVIIITTINGFAVSLYNPSLPAIASSFQTSVRYAQMSLTLYLFGVGLSQIIYGPLSDFWGRRPTLLLGISILFIGTIISILSPDISWFNFGRLIQGLGCGSISVSVRAIIRDKFHNDKLAIAFSYLVMGSAVTPMLAPFFGGFLQIWFGWKGVFSAFLIYICAILCFLALYLPETIHIKKASLSTKLIIADYKVLLSNRIYLSYISIILLAYTCQILYLTTSPFIFQQQLNISASYYGTLLVLPIIFEILGNFMSTRLNRYLDSNYVLLIGTVTIFISGLLLTSSCFLHKISIWSVLIPICSTMLGAGLLFSNATSGSLMPFPTLAGTAAALSGFLQQVGSGAISVMGTALHTTSSLSLGVGLIFCSTLMIIAYMSLKTANLSFECASD